MALVKCDECGKSISNRATACPQCGCPVSVGGGFVSIPSSNSSQYIPPQSSSSSNSSNSSGGGGSVLGGIAMVAGGIFVCVLAFKVFNFIIGLFGGVLAFIGFALMSFAS